MDKKNTKLALLNRVRINQRCLVEDVIPLLDNLPLQQSKVARDRLRVAINRIYALIEGNDLYLKASMREDTRWLSEGARQEQAENG